MYVTWFDNTTGNYEIYYKKSSDNGATFDPTINLSNTPEDSFSPQIAVSGSNVAVVWVEHVNSYYWKIFFRASTDGGISFGPTLQLSENTSGVVETPNVAVSGSNVYVVWIEIADVLFRGSNDNGVTFGPTINLSNTPQYSFPPRIAVSGSNVYVVWYDTIDPTSGSEVLFRRSTNGGASFDNAVNLSNNPANSMYPRIVVSGSNIYLVWANSEFFGGLKSLFFISSKDTGLTFDCNIIDITDALTDSIDPRIALSNSSILVVWGDPPYDPTINSEIFLAQGRR